MSTVDKDADINWYDVLQVPMSSTTEEIEKAGRQLSKKYHPDRNKDADAPRKFLEVQKAKGVLLDAEKRTILDTKLSATLKRKAYESERVQTMDANRKRLREDFEKRMAAASAGVSAAAGQVRQGPSGVGNPKNVVAPRDSMGTKLNKLRQDGRERAEALRQETKSASPGRGAGAGPELADRGGEIKVKWRRNPGVLSESDESLRTRFGAFGEVVRVVLHRDKGNQAAVVFASSEAAQAAVDYFADSGEYRVVLADGRRARMFTFNYSTGGGGSSTSLSELGGRADRSSPSPAAEAEAELSQQGKPVFSTDDGEIFIATSLAELKTREASLMARLVV